MSDGPVPQSDIILYQTEDGRTRIQCRLESETLWLTQAQMAELFQITPQNVTLHLRAIFAAGELAEAATCKDYLQVRCEGGREVTRKLRHYRLEAILAVGFRVRSHRGTQFRQWATARVIRSLPGARIPRPTARDGMNPRRFYSQRGVDRNRHGAAGGNRRSRPKLDHVLRSGSIRTPQRSAR
jgi:hypothetical protein